MKEAFYRARMKLKGKTTKDLGLSEANNIYISESFTASNRELFNEALELPYMFCVVVCLSIVCADLN